MGRYRNQQQPGMLFHVTQRGNNRNDIYQTDAEKTLLTQILGKYARKHDVRILYYTILNNHYHVLIKAGNQPISQFFMAVNVKFSRYYNRKYERTGTIYEGPYKRFKVCDNQYLMNIIGYIAWNPVKAGLCIRPHEYKWSSHHEFLTRDAQGITDFDALFDLIGSDRNTALANYAFKLQEKTSRFDWMGNLEKDEQLRTPSQILHEEFQRYCDDRRLSGAKQDYIRSGNCPPELKWYRNEFLLSMREKCIAGKAINRFLSLRKKTMRKDYRS